MKKRKQKQIRRAAKGQPQKLRIGYLSSDFGAGRTRDLLPMYFFSYDRLRFEVYAYHTGAGGDTELFSKEVPLRELGAMSAQEAAAAIRADGIDLLVDLSLRAPNAMTREIMALRPARHIVSLAADCPAGLAAALPLVEGAPILAHCYTPFQRVHDYTYRTPLLDAPMPTIGVVGAFAEGAAQTLVGLLCSVLQGLPTVRLILPAAIAAALTEADIARIAEADVPPLMQESARGYLAALKPLRKAAKEEFIIAVLTQDKEAFAALCEQHALNEGFIRSTIWRIIAALVPAEMKDPDMWNPDRDQPRFSENYCPVCGRQPVLADLRKYREGRTRDLVCGGCGTRWHYTRVGCVYCGNTDLQKMHTLEPEGSDIMRLDVCDACHHYIKTYRGPVDDDTSDFIYRQDWATVHLDLLAEEQGLQKKGNPILE